MGTIATLTLDIVGRSDKLRAELVKSRKQTKSWTDQVRQQTKIATGAFVGMSGATVAALTAIYSSVSQSSDALVKHADKLGINVEKLQALHHAGELTGVSTQNMNTSLQRMTRRVAEAANGTGEAVSAIQALNLNAKELAGLSPDQQFAKIADAMQGVDNRGEQLRLTVKLFDSEGAGLVNTLALGSEGLAEMEKEVEGLGIALTRVDLAKIEAANDEFFRAKQATTAFGKAFTAEVAPIVGALSKQFLKAAKDAGGFGQIAQNVVAATVNAVGFAADAVNSLRVTWLMVRQAVAEYINVFVQAYTTIARYGGSLAEKMGFDASGINAVAEFGDSFQGTVSSMREELAAAANAEPPSHAIKRFVENAQKAANEAAAKVAQTAKDNIGNTFDGENPQLIEKTKAENEKIISLHKEKYQRIHQAALEASGNHAAVENLRYQRLQEEMELERQRLTDRNLMTQELQTQFYQMEEWAAKEHSDRLVAIKQDEIGKQREAQKLIYGGARDLFGSMAELTAAFGKKQSGLYKVMFAASKGFAIAESTVNIQQGISGAATLPFPANLEAMATVASETAGILSTINGTNYSGAYQQGGIIPGSSYSGDNLIANVNSGEMILNSAQQAQLFDMANGRRGGAGDVVVNVTFIEDAERAGQVAQSQNDQGEIVIEAVVSNIRSRTEVTDALASVGNFQRVGR